MELEEAIGWQKIMIDEHQKSAKTYPNSNAHLRAEALSVVLQKLEGNKTNLEEKDKQLKTLNHTNKSYKGIINKQNEIIDEMAYEIDNYQIQEYFVCGEEYSDCFEKEPKKKNCKNCIKNYFRKKVTNE